MIQFWDINSGKILLTLCGHTDSVNTVKLINSFTLASGSDDNTIIIWDISVATIIHILTNHTSYVNSVEYLSNGYLVSILNYSISYSTISNTN